VLSIVSILLHADKEISNVVVIDNIIVLLFFIVVNINKQGAVVAYYSRQEHFEVLAKDKSWHLIFFSVSNVRICEKAQIYKGNTKNRIDNLFIVNNNCLDSRQVFHLSMQS